jgi:hypothetical protein
MRALEAVIDSYKAEMTGHTPRDLAQSEMEVALYEAVRGMCQWRLGRSGPPGAGPVEGERAPEPKTVDEIIRCLKRILKSVNKWTKIGGRTGYLDFIVRYVR